VCAESISGRHADRTHGGRYIWSHRRTSSAPLINSRTSSKVPSTSTISYRSRRRIGSARSTGPHVDWVQTKTTWPGGQHCPGAVLVARQAHAALARPAPNQDACYGEPRRHSYLSWCRTPAQCAVSSPPSARSPSSPRVRSVRPVTAMQLRSA